MPNDAVTIALATAAGVAVKLFMKYVAPPRTPPLTRPIPDSSAISIHSFWVISPIWRSAESRRFTDSAKVLAPSRAAATTEAFAPSLKVGRLSRYARSRIRSSSCWSSTRLSAIVLPIAFFCTCAYSNSDGSRSLMSTFDEAKNS